MSRRLSAGERIAIAEQELDHAGAGSAVEALRRYGRADEAGPGEYQERRIHQPTGLPYRLCIFAYRSEAEVVLNVCVSPLPEKVRAGGRFRGLGDFVAGWRSSPTVRVKRLPD